MSFNFDAMDHEYFMREALKEAELAGRAGEKPIGAVIVHQGQVIGRGRARHLARRSGIAHAEMNALQQAEQMIYAHKHDGCVIYTTLEPCVMCLGAVVMSDVDDIFLPWRIIGSSQPRCWRMITCAGISGITLGASWRTRVSICGSVLIRTSWRCSRKAGSHRNDCHSAESPKSDSSSMHGKKKYAQEVRYRMPILW